MKKTILQTTLYVVAVCFITACSKGDDKKAEDDTSTGDHTYRIEIAGGKTYQGSVPKEAPGVVSVYNPIAFVVYNEEIDNEVVGGTLMDVPSDFQFMVGVVLDGNNRPTIATSGAGIVFGQRSMEDKYTPAGPVDMTLKNYKEHSMRLFGEDGTVASFTLNFSGKFKLGVSGEEIDVTGEIVVASP